MSYFNVVTLSASFWECGSYCDGAPGAATLFCAYCASAGGNALTLGVPGDTVADLKAASDHAIGKMYTFPGTERPTAFVLGDSGSMLAEPAVFLSTMSDILDDWGAMPGTQLYVMAAPPAEGAISCLWSDNGGPFDRPTYEQFKRDHAALAATKGAILINAWDGWQSTGEIRPDDPSGSPGCGDFHPRAEDRAAAARRVFETVTGLQADSLCPECPDVPTVPPIAPPSYPAAGDIMTYSGLTAALYGYFGHYPDPDPGYAAFISQLVEMAEGRIYNSLRHPSMIAAVDVTNLVEIEPRRYSVPAECLEPHSVFSPTKRWEPTSADLFYKGITQDSACPDWRAYTFIGRELHFAAEPAGDEVLRYYARPPKIADDETTPVFQLFPQVFVNACLAEAARFLREPADVIAQYERERETGIVEINQAAWSAELAAAQPYRVQRGI